ncbi:MAG: glycoside hydrolase family 38 C-terminal domain-containing protein [Paludibacter sp.]|nr:glycoside hydrolase family 38 C-terminal domain-containing protein [Paludibacter sp.]
MKKRLLTIFTGSLMCALLLAQPTAQKKGKAYLVSNAHFDTQWNWDVQRSISDYIPKTMRQNLMLMDKYPNYIFNFEGGIKYAWMKEYFPLEYELVKKRIAEGRWHVTGSTWDATDANIPSPESTTRNILYGQHYYRDEFGVQGTDIFLPDCFGFGYTLPSMAAHSGLIGFSTQKLQWRHKPFHGDSKIPFEIGLWEGVDGSRVMLVADGKSYVTKWKDEDLSKNPQLLDYVGESPIKSVYHYYGTGDTGGAPTIESVRAVEKGLAGNGPVEIISATSDQLYKDFLPFENHPELPLFKGELLMDVHATGCYTSQAAMKRYNRLNELLGDAAERSAVVADWLGAVEYPGQTLTEAWKRFIWHQFHDDLTGTSTPRAYEFSWNDELISLKQFGNVLTTSTGAVSRALNTNVKGLPLVLFNPLVIPVAENIEIEVPASKATDRFIVYDENGKALPTQTGSYTNGKLTLVVTAKLPSCGYVVYDIRKGKPGSKSTIKINNNSIENSVYRVSLDVNGDIASIFDKQNNRELVKSGQAIRLALFPENESFAWPAWEILKKTMDKAPVSITENIKISVAEQGAVRGSLRVERTYGKSNFVQYIRLHEGAQADRIDIVNEIDWQTTNALLKAEFPLSVSNPEATYDLGLGAIKRGNNTDIAYEIFAQQWADLTDKKGDYGVAVLNDCKYGWDKPNDNTIRLTLLHTPKTRGGYAYQDKQDFGKHIFTYSIVGHTKDYVSAGIVHKAEQLNQQPKSYIAATKQAGELGSSFSFLQNNNTNVLIKAIKQAEKSDEYVIRLYESSGQNKQAATLTFPAQILSAKELNGVEDEIGTAQFEGNKLKIDIKAFGVKTFKVKLANAGKASLNKVSTAALSLPFDTKSTTYNAFRNTANFDGKGNSFAAELFPETIDFKGIRFELAGADEPNALKCRGQVIDLPQGNFNSVYLLTASTGTDMKATFTVNQQKQEVVVPSYTGFIGQWGHTGQTESYLKPADIAFVGTHRHSMSENKDLPYEFTYMFAVTVDLPKGAKQLVLPENSKIVIFAATAVQDENNGLMSATDILKVALPEPEISEAELAKYNLLFGKPVIEKTGQVNRSERAEHATDEDVSTKWCDNGSSSPKYIVVDLGVERTLRGWSVFHAGLEGSEFITRDFDLQVKLKQDEEWRTVDSVTGNKSLETDRKLPGEVKARYVKLNIIKGEQNFGNVARIYDFQVY